MKKVTKVPPKTIKNPRSKKAEHAVKPKPEVRTEVSFVSQAQVATELQSLQRRRSIVIKSRMMQETRLQAIVAGTLGYSSHMEEKERNEVFAKARQLIKDVETCKAHHPLEEIIHATMRGVNEFNAHQEFLEEQMLDQVGKLTNIVAWINQPEQAGVGLITIATIIGETGDLANYANPAKVWRRMGCAPFTFDGKTLMGSTWKSGKEGKLSKEAWTEFGYSPRRRSIAYVIGKNLMMQNVRREGRGESKKILYTGPYRARYEEAKARFKDVHPDYKPGRCDNHGILLAAKLFMKNLWMLWNNYPAHTKTWE